MGQSQSLWATYKLTRSVYLGQRDPIRFSNILLTFFLCILELNRKWLKGHALKSDVEYMYVALVLYFVFHFYNFHKML